MIDKNNVIKLRPRSDVIITTTNAVKKYTVAAVTLAIGITAIAMTVAMKGEYVEKSISG